MKSVWLYYAAVLQIASSWCGSGYLFSIWCGSGAESDFSVWCGSQTGSCSSSRWWKSPTTGLQILYYSVFSLHASIVSVHDPPRLYFEPPHLLSCQLCLGSQPGRTPTLPLVFKSKGPPSATRHLGGGGGWAGLWCIQTQNRDVNNFTYRTVPSYVNSTTAFKSQCMSVTIYVILCHVFHVYDPLHVYMMSFVTGRVSTFLRLSSTYSALFTSVVEP
jgi:hypothetical protein